MELVECALQQFIVLARRQMPLFNNLVEQQPILLLNRKGDGWSGEGVRESPTSSEPWVFENFSEVFALVGIRMQHTDKEVAHQRLFFRLWELRLTCESFLFLNGLQSVIVSIGVPLPEEVDELAELTIAYLEETDA